MHKGVGLSPTGEAVSNFSAGLSKSGIAVASNCG